jgi:excisionase family DNA binding protein
VSAPSLADDVWLTTAEAAAYTKRNPGTVRAAAASGVLESTSGGRGRGRRYRTEWLDTWTTRPGPLRDRTA